MNADDTLQALRHAFDDSFATAASDGRQAMTTLLLVDIGAERFALPLAALSGFEPLRRCVPVAGAAAGVVGLAGVRGRTLPVFDLAQALGLTAAEPLQWLALHGSGASTLGFGFARFAGQVQVASSSISPAAEALSRPCASQLLSLDQRPVAVLDLAAMAAARRA